MKGSVRKRGTTWSYRIDFGKIDGRRNQIEKGGYKTKKEADKALTDALYQFHNTGDYVENKKITFQEGIEKAQIPMKEFLLKQTRDEDIKLFLDSARIDKNDATRENLPLQVLVPAFAISELKTAFQIGFLIYLPFLLIDLVVSSALMSMGMFMLPPAMISLPFKLLLFIMVDGWNLLIKSLILSFN